MNKYQEALDGLKDTKCDEINNCKQCSLTSYCGHYQCIKTLQELVDKETPKKPSYIIRESEFDYYKMKFTTPSVNVCPVCHLPINDVYHNYCARCGQKLDWSGEDA